MTLDTVHPYLDAEHPVRFAHRGSCVLWPENTMVAFSAVAEMGYRYIEIDVRITADGVPVVFHDAALERLTNGAGRLADWAWDDLRRLDAAWGFGGADGTHPYRSSGVSIPTLDEVFATFPDTRFNIDLKAPGSEWPVADAIARHRRWSSVLVGGFSDRRIARFRRVTRGAVATSAGPLAALRMWTASRGGRTTMSPVVAYQVPFNRRDLRLDEKFIDAVHRSGAHVHAWTVNDPGDMHRLLDLGVDGIVTDRPDLLDQVIEDRSG